MKKTYSKPSILIEKFALSTNIAGDCERPFTLIGQYECGVPDDNGYGDIIFSFDVASNCTVEGIGDKHIYDGFCYHIPSETNQLFNS